MIKCAYWKIEIDLVGGWESYFLEGSCNFHFELEGDGKEEKQRHMPLPPIISSFCKSGLV